MKAWRDKLLTAVGVRVSVEGFQSDPDEQRFLRIIPGGRQVLHIAFIQHPNDFDVTVDVAVRIDEVERLVNARNASLSKNEKELTCTVGAELGNIEGRGQRRWHVAEEKHVDSVADDIAREFRLVGLPYLQRFQQMEALFSTLRDNGQEGWRHAPVHSARCMRAVALASILGKSDLSRLIREEETFLSERRDFGLAAFQDFAASLEASTP